MSPGDDLRAGPLVIPPSELLIRASRAGGPGGQHVNTSSTRIEVRWNVRTSQAPSETQRTRILERLATRIDGDGWLRVVAAPTRSQLQNREAATRRLLELVARALRVRKARKRTRIPRAEREKRLAAKRHRSTIKRGRQGRTDDE